MDPNLVYSIQPGPYWDWKVALDLFFGGAGVGAILFAIALDVMFQGRYERICRTAAWLSPILVVLGLLFLLLKLGRPQLLILTFTHLAPTSPLWWGGIFQTLLVVGSIWYALKWRRGHVVGRRPLGWALVPIAVIVGAYHGLLLAVITSRPLWNTGPTVVAAILGFAATGIAAVMLIHLCRMKLAGRLVEGEHLNHFLDDMKPVRNVLVISLLLQLGTFFLWWLSLRFGSLQDVQALVAANTAFGTMFWVLGIGLGLVLPLALGGYAVWRGEAANRGLQVQMIGWTSLFILVGGLFFRLAVVLGGQEPLPIPGL
jgi:formate-dependent nitrite reductase membrane component NrfD